MRAVRLNGSNGPADLAVEQVDVPALRSGEALVLVHAAAITRDELTWPVDRLPAIPSYEVSGTVTAVAADVEGVSVGDAVFALTPFDRDGAAAEFVAVPADILAPKPKTLSHVESAAIPLPALSAWQGLFDYGRLEKGERVLIHGATGGVGRFAVQLARANGAHVIGTASSNVDDASKVGAHELIDRRSVRFEEALEPVDLVFDTVGGDLLARSPEVLRAGGRLVSIAEEPPDGVTGVYFVVEPNRQQLLEIAGLAERGILTPAIDSVFPLSDARAAFERSMVAGKRGKVVLAIDVESTGGSSFG
jgi:NADPH:quinone reductase-like Zn-dependent oxidoreductase